MSTTSTPSQSASKNQKYSDGLTKALNDANELIVLIDSVVTDLVHGKTMKDIAEKHKKTPQFLNRQVAIYGLQALEFFRGKALNEWVFYPQVAARLVNLVDLTEEKAVEHSKSIEGTLSQIAAGIPLRTISSKTRISMDNLNIYIAVFSTQLVQDLHEAKVEKPTLFAAMAKMRTGMHAQKALYDAGEELLKAEKDLEDAAKAKAKAEAKAAEAAVEYKESKPTKPADWTGASGATSARDHSLED